MVRKKLLKLGVMIFSLAFMVTSLAACGNKEEVSKDTPSKNVEQTIVYNLGAEPETLDPALNSATDGSTVLCNTFEGLMSLDDKDTPIPGVAEKYEVSSDGLTYKFFLRKDAKWSDGKAVKAQDFEYAWKRVLKKETAAKYATQLYYLKNGEKYNKGEIDEKEVGVKALDDTTLEVKIENPTGYFLSLMSFPTYFPVRQDVVEKDPKGWAMNPSVIVSNGPFKMTDYKAKDSLTMEKNSNYWDVKNIKLNKVVMKMIVNQNTALSAFKTGELDFIAAPPAQEIPTLLKDKVAKVAPILSTYYYAINISDKANGVDANAAKVLQDAKVRKALSYAMDRKVIAEKVAKGGQIPAFSFVPEGINETGTTKKFANKEYFKPTGDVEKAKELLKEAGFEGGKGFPKMTIGYNDMETHQNIATAIQDMWKKNLGIEVELKKEEWKVFQKTRQEKQYLIARNGWNGDYVDAMTFLDLFTSDSGNNDPGYANKDFDNLIAQAKKEADPTKRTEIMHKAEDKLMDDMPIIPIYYGTAIICVKDKVQNSHYSSLGHVYFRNAYIK